MKIVFRTDASITIGTGHVMRCLTLAKALSEKGADVQFICRDHMGNLIDKIQQQGFFVHVLRTRNGNCKPDANPKLFHSEWLGVTQQLDAKECLQIIGEIQPNWLIVDHYSIDQTWHKVLKIYCDKLMVIDDLGDRTHLCNLLLDQNYGATADKYRNLVPEHCKILTGSQYSLLRAEFAKWRKFSLERRQEVRSVKNILITMGGVDSDNYTGQILEQLINTELNPASEVLVVMGSTAPHLEKVKELSKKMSLKTVIKTDVTNMAELMARADLAIGAAGATTWERCCLGLPTIQLIIAENQRQIAQALARDNAVKLIDKLDQLSSLVITASQWIKSIGSNSSKICDGLGCQRVVEALLEKSES